MSLLGKAWDKIKGGYNWVDERLGGHLPGGTPSGPQIGDTIDMGSVPYFTPGQANPGMPGSQYPGMPGSQFGGPGGDPIVAGYDKTPDFTKVKTSDGIGSRVGRWLGDNADLVLGVAGLGLQAYGAHQAGQQEDRALDLEEEAMRSSMANQTRSLDLREAEMQREWEDEEQERQRRRRAYQNILAARAAGGRAPVRAQPVQMES